MVNLAAFGSRGVAAIVGEVDWAAAPSLLCRLVCRDKGALAEVAAVPVTPVPTSLVTSLVRSLLPLSLVAVDPARTVPNIGLKAGAAEAVPFDVGLGIGGSRSSPVAEADRTLRPSTETALRDLAFKGDEASLAALRLAAAIFSASSTAACSSSAGMLTHFVFSEHTYQQDDLMTKKHSLGPTVEESATLSSSPSFFSLSTFFSSSFLTTAAAWLTSGHISLPPRLKTADVGSELAFFFFFPRLVFASSSFFGGIDPFGRLEDVLLTDPKTRDDLDVSTRA
jgi:hypothetical protein